MVGGSRRQAQAVSRGSRGIGNVVAQRQRGRIKQTNVKMTRFVVYHIYRKQATTSLSTSFSPLPPWLLQVGYMQLVFKCERVNEHKAKTSHHLADCFLELPRHQSLLPTS